MKALTREDYIKTEASIGISELEGTARGVGSSPQIKKQGCSRSGAVGFRGRAVLPTP